MAFTHTRASGGEITSTMTYEAKTRGWGRESLGSASCSLAELPAWLKYAITEGFVLDPGINPNLTGDGVWLVTENDTRTKWWSLTGAPGTMINLVIQALANFDEATQSRFRQDQHS